MWLGFGKNIGGFRVGVGTRLKFSSGGRSRGPTQAQIAKLEKADFLRRVAGEANSLLQEFLVNNNIEPSYANKHKLDLDLFFENSSETENYKLFVSAIKEIQEVVSKVNYGGNLTGARKDRLVDLIFSMREIVDRSGPGLNVVADQVSEKYKKISIVTMMAIFTTLVVLVAALKLLFVPSESDWLALIIGTAMLSGIVYLPIHFILKSIAKVKYKKLAVQTMKQIYGL